VTGYKGGSPPDDLCIRWLEWGAWSGFFEIKLDDSMPSDRPDAVQEAYRNAANQRMELLPYLYSLANSSAKNGVLMKPMAYLYPQDSQTYSIWDQYLLGPSFLVAPILQEGTSREVYFPAGKWFDFYDPTQEVNGGARLKVQASLSKIPVYIKQNSIYLTGSIYRGSVKKWMPEFEKQKHLIIHAFPGELGEENTFTYVDALDRNKEKAVHLGADQSKEVTLDYGAMSLPGEIKIRLTHAPKTVTFNGKAIENVDYDKGKMLLTIPFAAHETVVVKVQQL
jgi:alpha-glucosidase (family GH31 glycosyl hydrolase)